MLNSEVFVIHFFFGKQLNKTRQFSFFFVTRWWVTHWMAKFHQMFEIVLPPMSVVASPATCLLCYLKVKISVMFCLLFSRFWKIILSSLLDVLVKSEKFVFCQDVVILVQARAIGDLVSEWWIVDLEWICRYASSVVQCSVVVFSGTSTSDLVYMNVMVIFFCNTISVATALAEISSPCDFA